MSAYPRFFSPERAAVPNASMTDIVTTDCDVMGIEVSNSTGATITLTVQDKLGTPKKLVDAINVDPNTPLILAFNNEGHCTGGVSWQASAAGLTGRIWGMRHAGLTMNSNGFV